MRAAAVYVAACRGAVELASTSGIGDEAPPCALRSSFSEGHPIVAIHASTLVTSH